MKLKLDKPFIVHVRNREFVRTEEFSWKNGTLINISFTAQKRKAKQGKIFGFFLLEKL